MQQQKKTFSHSIIEIKALYFLLNSDMLNLIKSNFDFLGCIYIVAWKLQITNIYL